MYYEPEQAPHPCHSLDHAGEFRIKKVVRDVQPEFFMIVILFRIKTMLILILMSNAHNVTRGSKIIRMKMPTTLTTICMS